MSENVPMGHAVEQYTLPNRKVSSSHTRAAPAVADAAERAICVRAAARAMGCTCGPIMRQAAEAMKKSTARRILMALSCFMSSTLALLPLLFAQHGLLLALHLLKARHEA